MLASSAREEMDKLSHLDYRHEWLSIRARRRQGEMLGLVRLKDELDEKTAEFAILVRSRLKGTGSVFSSSARHRLRQRKGLRRV